MASFLTIPELMTMVLEYSRSQEDLLNFALVCTQWTDWALDVRWRNCDVPLSAVLRPLLSLANSIENSTQHQDFTDEQWAAFMAISTKVTSVVCDFALPDDLHQPLRTRIDHSSENPFQRVQKLTVVLGETRTWPAHFVSESPALSSYRLCSGAPGDKYPKHTALTLIFRDIIQRNPTITDVELDLPGFTVIPPLNSMRELRRLSCHRHKIVQLWWRILSLCEQLSELRLEETSLGRDWGVELGDVTFPVLRSLLLDVEEVMAATIISRSRFPALDNLSFGSRCLSADEMGRARVHLNKWSPLLRF